MRLGKCTLRKKKKEHRAHNVVLQFLRLRLLTLSMRSYCCSRMLRICSKTV